jgi:hypothetical protein
VCVLKKKKKVKRKTSWERENEPSSLGFFESEGGLTDSHSPTKIIVRTLTRLIALR